MSARPKRAARRLTTKEEANFQCEIKGCGKLFSRSYNYKAHMETHDEKARVPVPVRRARLQQALRAQDGSAAASPEKDTLRRHMEDGCSKRFDIGTLDVRADAYDGGMHPGARPMAPLGHILPPSGGLPPLTMPPLCGSSILGSMGMRPKDVIGDHAQGHSWGR
ncbi:hypothetical protein N0V88_000453 [Collariella sp. IMI 366227]|nr:hypothetical protein N0V88_000453 [Collariella sp. IMI 366227]